MLNHICDHTSVRIWRHALKLLQREGNDGMPRHGPCRVRQQGLLEDAEPALWCPGIKQLLAQVASARSPQDVEGHVRFLQLIGGQWKKWECAAWFEVDAHDRSLAGSIDDEAFRMRTADHAPTKVLKLVGMLPVVHFN